MAIQHGFVLNQGHQVHYLYGGDDGDPLLLLHGGGTDSAVLSRGHLISDLAATHRVFAPDWPGYGESDRPDIQYTIPFYTSVLGDLIHALALRQPNLVGVSMGGAIAFGFTLDHSQAVNKLVHGAHDKLVPLKYAQQAQARIPGAQLIVLTDAGHWSQREQPEQFL